MNNIFCIIPLKGTVFINSYECDVLPIDLFQHDFSNLFRACHDATKNRTY